MITKSQQMLTFRDGEVQIHHAPFSKITTEKIKFFADASALYNMVTDISFCFMYSLRIDILVTIYFFLEL
jgi:hypothetical protein